MTLRLMESRSHLPVEPEATSAFLAFARRQMMRHGSWLVGVLLVIVALWTLPASVTEIRSPEGGTRLLLADMMTQAGNWPGYRGPSQQGIVPVNTPGGNASPQGHVPVWGHRTEGLTSSPCVWGTRVFFVEMTSQTAARLVCLHRDTGALLWSAAWTIADPARNPRGLPTPTCDGDHVFLPLVRAGRLHLQAWTLTGQQAWSCDAGPWHDANATVVSPVLHGPLVIVAADQPRSSWTPWQPQSYVAAIHRLTGNLVWRTLRPDGASSGVPVVATVADRSQLLLAGRGGVHSYDPATGQELWTCRWRSRQVHGGVVTDAQHVYAAGGQPEGDIVCIRADGTGDVTETHVVWRDRRMVADPIALTMADSVLIHQQGDGTLLAVDVASGKMVWRKKLPGAISTPALRYGSQLLCTDDTGTLHLLDLNRRGESVYEASLGATVLASPAAIDSGLMISTNQGMIRLKSVPGSLVQEPRATPQTR